MLSKTVSRIKLMSASRELLLKPTMKRELDTKEAHLLNMIMQLQIISLSYWL